MAKAAATAAQRRVIPCLVLALIAVQLLLAISASAQEFDTPTADDQSGNSTDTSAPATTDTSSSGPANYTVPDVVQVLNASGNFSTFLSIAAKANISSALQAFISRDNTSGATAFIPLNSAFTPDIVSAYGNLSAGNQSNLLLYHVLPTYYNRSQVVALFNVSTLAGYRLSAVNQSSDGVITVYASRNAANVSSANISGIPNPPSFPIAIYPIRSVLLPVEINIPSTSNSSSSNKTSSPAPAPSNSAAASISTVSIMSLLLIFGAVALY
jgi:hypothetical protein